MAAPTGTLDPPADTGAVEPDPTPLAERSDPLHWFAGRIHQVLDGLGEPSLLGLSARALAETVSGLLAAVPRLEALALAAVAQADAVDAATAAGCTSTAAWLRTLTPVTGARSTRLVKLAVALERPEHVPVAVALRTGRITVEHALVIVDAVDRLPRDPDGLDSLLGPVERRRAAAHLVTEAQSNDATVLKRLGRHLLDVIDPDGADARLAQALEAEEAEAARATAFTIRHDEDGASRGTFTIPTLQGLVLEQLLGAFANPKRPEAIPRVDEHGHRRAKAEVLGDAFVELIDRYPTKRLPAAGGTAVTVVVTVPLETLEGRLRSAGVLGSDHRISPAAARRLAAAHGLIPAVLGCPDGGEGPGDSRVLDLGRRRRLHDRHQRLALAVEQQGLCGIHDCDRPVTWCEAAHLAAWADGGKTSTTNGLLLCTRHHDLTEKPHLVLDRRPGGGYHLRQRE